MGKILKIFFTFIAAVFIILGLVAVALPYFFSPNDFKPQIAAAVKDKTGRDLDITGDLELSVFPWLGVNTGKIILSNPPGFEQHAFAEIDKSAVKVKLIPLLSKKIEVDRIALDGLSLYLVKNKQGVTNWDDLMPAPKDRPTGAETEKTPSKVPAEQQTLDIAGIELKNASINWIDQRSGDRILVKALNLDTDKLAFAKPVAIKLRFTLEKPETQLTESIELTTKLNIAADLAHFGLKDFDLASHTEAKAVPEGGIDTRIQAQATLDMTSQQLDVSALKLSSGDLNISGHITGTSIKDSPVFTGPVTIAQFNPAKVLKQWNIPLPVMRDPEALSRLSAEFNVEATPTSADVDNLMLQLDHSTIKGNTRIENFSHPAITFNLAVDTLDLDRYLAPEPEQDPATKAIASPAAAVAAGASLFPVATLKKLNANGLLAIDKIKINNLSMQGINLKLTASNGVINTEQAVKTFYQGSYNGNLMLNVNRPHPVLTLNEQLRNVQVEPLYKDFKGKNSRLTGSVDASVRLQGAGNDAKSLKSTLNGQLSFAFNNGVVKGINLQQIIDDAKSIIKGTPLATDNPKDQTVFSEIKGTADVIDGRIVNKDLAAHSSKLRVTGEGNADLTSEQLDYKLTARMIKSKATDTEPERLSSLPVLINITGTFDKPVFTLDVANMLIEKNKEKIEQKKEELLEKLDKKLEKKLGPGGASDLLKRFF
ncbi:MAG: AsmA family protein [Gammaproteobacteria bacterium]